MKKVLIVGYFGYGNMGDEVSLLIIKKHLDELCMPYHVLGGDKPTSPIFRLTSLRGALLESSAVLFCGGNLLQNETSNRSLFYYLYVTRLAKAMKIPVFFAGGGIGAIRGTSAKRQVEKALFGIDFFGARTPYDFESIRSFAIKRKIPMPDICFTLPSKSEKKRDVFAYIPKSRDTATEGKIKAIAQSRCLSPLIIPLDYSRDFKVCRDIGKRLGAPITVFNSSEELISKLSACRFTVSERLHGAIFSLLGHTPVFLSDRAEKCRALIDNIDWLSSAFGISSPLNPLFQLDSEKIKELGAHSSEFDVILNNLKSASFTGLSKLFQHLHAALLL